jgi:UDP:flavonoid glycosyltransferase YjiC (YdhE family)
MFFNLWQSSTCPPLHTAVIPGRGVAGSLPAIVLLWQRFLFWKAVLLWKMALFSGGSDRFSLLRDYAEKLGVDWRAQTDCRHWLIPFVYPRLPLLKICPEDLEFPTRNPAGQWQVGPLLCENRDTLPFLADKEQNSVDTFLRQAKMESKKILYCSFGSFHTDGPYFWLKLAEAVGESDWRVVFALGGKTRRDELGPLPSNILCLDFAPQMEILQLAHGAVVHAGLGTIWECIAHQVPMLVFPFAMNDQQGNAARIAYHGVGIVGDCGADAAKLRLQIETILNDQTIREKVREISEKGKRADERLAMAVEAILSFRP